MSNAVITHYETRPGFALCGKAPGIFVCYSTDRSAVTCKRCLASLAKRDRAFQRKARKGLERTTYRGASGAIYIGTTLESAVCSKPRRDAARAIAREDKRAL